MGSPGSAVTTAREGALPGYARLPGHVPVAYTPPLREHAEELRGLLASGSGTMAEILAVQTPDLVALLVADTDWPRAPRENARAYPPGLPYFTRAARPPALVLPESLSPAFEPRTAATWPLVVWHELAHAFLLQESLVRTPAWIRELLPQALSAAVARRERLPLDEHLSLVDRRPGFTVRGFGGRAGAGEQMAFQNLLLSLAAAALGEFGEGWLRRLAHALWGRSEPVGEEEAEGMLAEALGPGGGGWLRSREEF